ncbi:hypothetical protein Ndes2526B_g01099 [Nannochloris sp. 'desiccata']
MANRSSPRQQTQEIPALVSLSLECLASNPNYLDMPSVGALPEELAIALFDRIVAKGKLTPRLLNYFEKAEQEAVLERVKQLGISKWTPPLIKDHRNTDLGPRKPWW